MKYIQPPLWAMLLGCALTAVWAQTITLDGTGSGRIYDGVGTLSAGASSRLLIDYPEPQRSQILDYLFLPNYGASMQILKVEIGSGVNSTDGSEPSHEPEKGVENYHRGYEWWLMQEAKARNPNIKLWGLEWGAPGWIGNGTFWSNDNIGHIIRWVQHAKKDYGLTIDYLGGWNERAPAAQNLVYFTWLRQALNDSGLSAVKIVSDDAFNWAVATDMAKNPIYLDAVDIGASHYTCGYMTTKSTSCATSNTAVGLGKPLWSSEDGSMDYNGGANAMARALNHNYIDGKMTASINWSTIWSALPGLPFNGDGLMMAQSPWSGNYDVGKSIWVQAHHTQFVKPGWKYIDASCGFYAGNETNGSYVTLKDPASNNYSIITETLKATADRTVTFELSGGLSAETVHVWRSSFNTLNISNNIAVGKAATASSQWDATFVPAKAIDGNVGTRWNSAAGDIAGAWLQIDLGAAVPFNTVISREDELLRITGYKIQSSLNGTTWIDQATGANLGSEKTDIFPSVTARYVRLLILGASDTPTIDEFEVYNGTPNLLGDFFVKQADIIPVNNAFTLTLPSGTLTSITTTTGQAKGSAGTPPAATIFPIPYFDNFKSYGGTAKTPRYFSDWDGTFETVTCAGGRTGTCLGQIVQRAGIDWNGIRHPWTLIGDLHWTDYQVETDFLQPQKGFVEVFGRLFGIGGTWSLSGYFLQVSNTGSWRLYRRSQNEAETDLVKGVVGSFQATAWHKLRVVFSGSGLEAWIDEVKVGVATDNTYPMGMAGLGTSGWVTAQFDNFSVTAPGAVTANARPAKLHGKISPRIFRNDSGGILISPSGTGPNVMDTKGRKANLERRRSRP